jgi:RimJ/RimL family protein N-acetyltransferase
MLIGEKVCLGPILQGDAPLLFSWTNNFELVRSNGPYRPTDEAKFNEWFASLGKDLSRVVFAIRKNGDLRLLGYVQIVNIQATSRIAEIGILVGSPPDQNQGYGQEAMRMAVDFCWRSLNLQRLSLWVIGDNPRAVHVYGKVGFQVEGLMPRAAYVDGRHLDVTVMGVLRTGEWI